MVRDLRIKRRFTYHMRISNKYIRNRVYRSKHWNRIRHLTNPFEYTHGNWYCTTAEQIKNHFEWIDQQARAIENGTHRQWVHAPKHFRKTIWQERKSQERVVMARIRQGDYDAEMPKFKRDADWLWF